MDANGFFLKGFRSAMQKAGKRGMRSRPLLARGAAGLETLSWRGRVAGPAAAS